jgi:hypothetical protein
MLHDDYWEFGLWQPDFTKFQSDVVQEEPWLSIKDLWPMARFIEFEDVLGGLDATEPTSLDVFGTLEPIFTMMVLLSPNLVSLKLRLDCEPARGDWMWRRDIYTISGIVGTMRGKPICNMCR